MVNRLSYTRAREGKVINTVINTKKEGLLLGYVRELYRMITLVTIICPRCGEKVQPFMLPKHEGDHTAIRCVCMKLTAR